MGFQSKTVCKGLSLQLVIFVLCTNTGHMVTGSDVCNMNWLFFFQNVMDVLTIQPSESGQIVVEPFDYDASSPQLFGIECGSKPGLFYIVHNVTGQVLDIERDSPHHVIVASIDDESLWQQWFVDYQNRRVTNAVTRFVLAIEDSNFVPGAAVVVEPQSEEITPNQLWIVTEYE
ncbi:hypothetical protein Zmor_001570 [Zophobas morio]|uniref:Ricin B lectin domain-containing protein n=1 Tax=Zophobas morio TaxID=2755281 RepID=A0AA38J273_9CUCU|nr:hypothetical protein Zmor_001570 [Zophobas morio]